MDHNSIVRECPIRGRTSRSTLKKCMCELMMDQNLTYREFLIKGGPLEIHLKIACTKFRYEKSDERGPMRYQALETSHQRDLE